MDWAIDHLEKEIHVKEVFNPNEIVDAIGVTKGKGFKGKLLTELVACCGLCSRSPEFAFLC